MEQLANADPKAFPARFNQVIAIPRVAGAQLALGDVPAAIETTNREVAFAQALVKDFPDKDQGKSLLASAYGNLADTYDRAGKYADSLKAWEQAIDLHRQLGAAEPDNVFLQDRLANAYLEYADALVHADQLDRAIEASGQAIVIAQFAW